MKYALIVLLLVLSACAPVPPPTLTLAISSGSPPRLSNDSPPPPLTASQAFSPSPAVLATPPVALSHTPSPTVEELSGPRPGVHLLLTDGRNAWPEELWPDHMAAARDAVGAGAFVVQLVTLDDLDPARWQRFMDLCRQHQLSPVLRLATTFDFESGYWRAPVPDPDGGYGAVAGAFAGLLAGLQWPDAPHYIIVGNEPNHGDEWGGVPDPAAYARFLVDMAGALRAVDPNMAILNAGMDHYSPSTNGRPLSNGMAYQDATSFLREMVDAEPELWKSIDVWSSHAYPEGAFVAPPWEQRWQIDCLFGAQCPADDPVGLPNRGINAYAYELALIARLGGPVYPVLVTETGWRHAESEVPDAADGAPGGLPPASLVADYLDLAWRGNDGRYPDLPEVGWTPWSTDGRLLGVVLFAFNGNPVEWGHTNWLRLDRSGAIRGTYPMSDVWRSEP